MNDLISRQAAIDALDKRFDSIPMNQTTEILLLRKDLRELPSAQPERIKGHWIDAVIPNDSGGLPVIVCDKCNTFFPLQFGDSHNFCPNCGAVMIGVRHE